MKISTRTGGVLELTKEGLVWSAGPGHVYGVLDNCVELREFLSAALGKLEESSKKAAVKRPEKKGK